MKSHSRAGAALAAVAMLAACATDGGKPSPSTDTAAAFVAQAHSARSDAERSGASAEQLARIDQAIEAGEVSFELALEAEHAFFACLDDRNIRYGDDGPAAYGEYPRLSYRIYASDPGPSDVCYMLEYAWIDDLYQTQPATLADIATEVMKRKDGIIECLRAAGIAVDDEPTYDELHAELFFGMFGFYQGDDPELADPARPTIDCYGPVGLNPQDV